MPHYVDCHKNCTQIGAHSICALPVTLRTKVMERMLAKVDALPVSKQASRILGEYAGVEVMLQQAVE